MDVKFFRKLFVHRDDVFDLQASDGSYRPRHTKLTDRVIEDHLRGRHTIGLCQINPKDDTVKWGVVDIDIEKKSGRRMIFMLKIGRINWRSS